MSRVSSFSFNKVVANAGVEGNERADMFVEKNSVSLNNISKSLAEMDLDDSEVEYETTNNHIFSTTNLNSHSTSLCLDQSPLSSSASSSPWVYPLGLVDYDKM